MNKKRQQRRRKFHFHFDETMFGGNNLAIHSTQHNGKPHIKSISDRKMEKIIVGRVESKEFRVNNVKN
jgi:hypothetical protein